MARIRTIKPEFCHSPSIAELTIPARLFFVLLWTEADDEGRLVNSPKRLAGCLFPNDENVTAAKVKGWIGECEKQDMLRPYNVHDNGYLEVVNWRAHQRISHPTPSRIPPPPWVEAPEAARRPTREPPEEATTDARTAPEHGASDSRLEVGSRKLEVGTTRTLATGSAEPTPAGSESGDFNEETLGLAEWYLEALDPDRAWSERRRAKALTDSRRVISWAQSALDDRPIEEAIGRCRDASERPTSVKYLVTTLRRVAAENDVELPDLEA